jgi:hypothetical protein
MTTRQRLQELVDQLCCSMQRSRRPAEPPVRDRLPAFVASVPAARAADPFEEILQTELEHRATP